MVPDGGLDRQARAEQTDHVAREARAPGLVEGATGIDRRDELLERLDEAAVPVVGQAGVRAGGGHQVGSAERCHGTPPDTGTLKS